ncbi:hypothetical protein [Lonepinella sp. MS14437]|uniref:hypothetical protein n=1 Tax=Lonepinella sp. MS14437 TaxID=3003620 RepID=UPI0036DE53D0
MTTSHSLHLNTLIEQFFNQLQQENTLQDDIYNEFSLQHELGIFLRHTLNPQGEKKYKVQFERNISDKILGLNINKDDIVKREIDVVILGENGEKYAVELKFPRNGQHPEQMYQFIKDIAFMEQLKQAGFTQTYCVCVVDDKNFYLGRSQGIYAYFRSPQIPIHGNIEKPTGKEKFEEEYKPIKVKGTYHVQWQELQGNYRYYVIACE